MITAEKIALIFSINRIIEIAYYFPFRYLVLVLKVVLFLHKSNPFFIQLYLF